MSLNMKISNDGYAFTEAHEGCRLTAYRDVVGVLTIGFGHTGTDVHDGMTITQDGADALLKKDMQHAEDSVNLLVKVSLTQNQFDALCDFVFNAGTGNFATSTLLRKLNMGLCSEAAQEFPRWIYAGGEVVQGLIHRRQDEQELFLKP